MVILSIKLSCDYFPISYTWELGHKRVNKLNNVLCWWEQECQSIFVYTVIAVEARKVQNKAPDWQKGLDKSVAWERSDDKQMLPKYLAV